MKLFSSLTNRIFVAAAALAVLAIAVAAYSVNVAVTAQAENELQRGLHEAGALLEENRTTLFGHFARELSQSFSICMLDHRNQQSVVERNRDAHVNIALHHDPVITPRGIQKGHLLEPPRHCVDHKRQICEGPAFTKLRDG